MGWIDRLFGRKAPSIGSGTEGVEQRTVENPAVPLTNESLAVALWGDPSAAGVSVTRERALRLGAVGGLRAGDCGGRGGAAAASVSPADSEGKERATDHPVYGLLHSLPNPEMTSFELRETLTGHILTWGWAYCEIEYDRAGRRKALWPLRPNRVKRVADGGTVRYEITLPDGSKTFLQRAQVWAIRGWSLEAWEAGSLIEAGRDAIGLGIAAEEYGSRFFGNDSRPGGVLEHPAKLSDQAAKRMRESWNAAHSGLGNAHRVAILEEGVKWQQIGISPENAQFLETRKFQRSEIAGLFRVPPHKIGDLEKATFSNIEQQSIDYVNDALVPLCTRIEQSINRDLLSVSERGTYFAEHLLAGRMRGEMLARYQAYAVGLQNGFLCPDDVREAENMNPLPDGLGAVFRGPLNMAPLGSEAPAASEDAASSSVEPDGSDESDESDLGNPAQDEQRSRLRIERRSVAGGRKEIGQSFKPAIEAVAQRVVNRETNDLQNARKKGQAGFREWMGTYLDADGPVVKDYLKPTMMTFAEQVIADVEREVGGKAPADVGIFAQGYVKSRAETWVEGLRRGLLKIDEREYESEDEWAAALDEFLVKRKAEHADDWAREEATRVLGAIGRFAYAAMGVATLVWMAVGETCPYCQEWDGRTISIEAQFLPAGEELAPEGADRFSSETDVGHPPLHDGCDCVVVAG